MSQQLRHFGVTSAGLRAAESSLLLSARSIDCNNIRVQDNHVEEGGEGGGEGGDDRYTVRWDAFSTQFSGETYCKINRYLSNT